MNKRAPCIKGTESFIYAGLQRFYIFYFACSGCAIAVGVL